MHAWLIATWDSLRSGFWFFPGGLLAAAILLGITMPLVDRSISDADRFWTEWPVVTASAARALLAALAGTQITVAGVVFSSVMVTLSLTTSQFGSRLLRTFLSHSVSQWTLGMFLATGLYCLLVLPTVSADPGHRFIPHLSLWLALLAAIASVIFFVAFIHYAATSLQAQYIVAEVAEDLNVSIEALFPEQLGTADEGGENAELDLDAHIPKPLRAFPRVLSAHCSGYLQGIDGERLLEITTHRDLLVRLHYRPGHFVTEQMPLATVYADLEDGVWEETSAALRNVFVFGWSRTPRQDVECAVEELVELAVRALSPGTNEPVTAISCIDFLCVSLSRLMRRKIPTPLRVDGRGQLRVIANAYTFESIVAAGFAPLRQHAAGSVMVLIRMLDGLSTLASLHQTEQQARVIGRQAELVIQITERSIEEPQSRADARARFQEIAEQLNRLP